MNNLLPYISGQLNNTLGSLPLFKPELYLGILFLLVLAADLFVTKKAVGIGRIIALVGLLVIIGYDYQQYAFFKDSNSPQLLFSGHAILYHSAVSLKLIIDVIAWLLLLYFPWDVQFKTHAKGLADGYTIIVASILGLHLMVMAFSMLSIFLSVEMVSIASYLLVAYRSENGFSAEAGLKYVLFGMAASAVMLYGMSLYYGFTGTLLLADFNAVAGLQQISSVSVTFALLLILAGIGFKLTFVPLHFWVPDVYEGAATPVTAYLSTLPKIAAFGLLVNFLTPFIFSNNWHHVNFRLILSVISIVSMIAGNFAAVWQQNIKRMLAYSSIGHTGFALMAIIAFTMQGISALMFYLAVYAIANLGALALATYFANMEKAETLNDYKGLGLKHPVASVSFVVLLISLTGLPVSAGFNGKLLVFSAVYNVYETTNDKILLVLLATGALTTVVALFYYIKIPLNLFLKKGNSPFTAGESLGFLTVFVILTVCLVLLFGIFPQLLAKFL